MHTASTDETPRSWESSVKSNALKWASDVLSNPQRSIQNISAEFCKLQTQQNAKVAHGGINQQEKNKSSDDDGDAASANSSRGEVKVQKHKTTFIHIDRINLPKLPCEFILTKAPSEDTVVHFWTTVWKEYVKVIVYFENSEASKSELTIRPYWPKVFGVSEHHYYGNYRIRPIYGQVAKAYTQKTLEIEDMESNEIRWVRHLVYADWPREEAVLSTESLFDFINKVDEELEKGKKDSMTYPFRVLVHDDVSTMRSGTFVVLRSLIGVIKIGQTPLVSLTMSTLLEQKAHKAQEVRLYYYIYYALIRYIVAKWDIPEETRIDWIRKARMIRKKSVTT